MKNTIKQLTAGIDDTFLSYFLPGADPYTVELRDKIWRLNQPSNIELIKFVTIIGPSGSGKNHFARICAGHRSWLDEKNSPGILDKGKNSSSGFASLDAYIDKLGEQNITSIPTEMIESALFGHTEGAFTGATKDNPGLFHDKGYSDLLLDEIGDAPLNIQVKLLSVLEGNKIKPVGGASEHSYHCNKRIFLATNHNLEELTKQGKFRADLLNRLNRFVVTIPSLKQKPHSILLIAQSILGRKCPEELKLNGELPLISSSDQKWIVQQDWPGNVRQLEGVIEKWLFYECKIEMKDLGLSGLYSEYKTSNDEHVFMSSIIEHEITNILNGRRAPGSVSKLIKELSKNTNEVIKAELHRWYTKNKPSEDSLKKIFPDMKITSIRSEFSRMQN